MDIDKLKAMAPGSIVFIKKDNKRYAGQAGRFSKINQNGNAGLIVAGVLIWVNPERLESGK